MKQFACGDVVPGCDATFTCETDDEILALVGDHAVSDHGITDISDELVTQVRARIVELV
jgi:predicted small metal-binding protein